MLIQSNWEGPVTGFGTVVGTMTGVGAPKSGSFGYHGVAYLDNGDGLTGSGSGTRESVGKHRWRTQMIVQISDGRALISEGEIDLASRSWNGKLFEK